MLSKYIQCNLGCIKISQQKMRLQSFCFNKIGKMLDFYSQFNPSPLSIKQFLDFGECYYSRAEIYDVHDWSEKNIKINIINFCISSVYLEFIDCLRVQWQKFRQMFSSSCSSCRKVPDSLSLLTSKFFLYQKLNYSVIDKTHYVDMLLRYFCWNFVVVDVLFTTFLRLFRPQLRSLNKLLVNLSEFSTKWIKNIKNRFYKVCFCE